MKRIFTLLLILFLFTTTGLYAKDYYKSEQIFNLVFDSTTHTLSIRTGTGSVISAQLQIWNGSSWVDGQANELSELKIVSSTKSLTGIYYDGKTAFVDGDLNLYVETSSNSYMNAVQSGIWNISESTCHVTNIVSVEDTNYVGKVSTGTMGLVSGGAITTVTFNDTFIECAFTFLGTSGTVTCNFKGGSLTMRNGGSYKLKAPKPQSGLKAIFEISDDATVDYISDELK